MSTGQRFLSCHVLLSDCILAGSGTRQDLKFRLVLWDRTLGRQARPILCLSLILTNDVDTMGK